MSTTKAIPLLALMAILIGRASLGDQVRPTDEQFSYELLADMVYDSSTNIADQATKADDIRDYFVGITPPGMTTYVQEGMPTVVGFDWERFPPAFVSGLVTQTIEGIMFSVVYVYRDAATTNRLYFNVNTQSLGYVDAALAYHADAQAYAPDEVVLRFDLVAEDDMIKYVWLHSRGSSYAVNGFLWPTNPVPTIKFTGIALTNNGVRLYLAYPDDFRPSFTNLDIYKSTILTQNLWSICITTNSSATTNWIAWTDITNGLKERFYAAGNADLDSDGDGLANSRETYLYHTVTNNWDSDGDGVSDGDEILKFGTDPLSQWDSALPYFSGFEVSNGYTVAVLNGQQGWTGTLGSRVQAGLVRAELQAVELPGGAESAYHHFATTAGVVVAEMSFYWGASEFAPPTNLPTLASCVISFNSTNGIVAYDGNGSGGGTWQTAPGTQLMKQWVTLKIEQNYATKKWKLFVNGTGSLTNLGFRDNSVTRFGTMRISSGLGESLGCDDIRITSPGP